MRIGGLQLACFIGIIKGQMRRDIKDLSGRTIILLQGEYPGPFEVLREIQNILDLRVSKSVYGLILISDHKEHRRIIIEQKSLPEKF